MASVRTEKAINKILEKIKQNLGDVVGAINIKAKDAAVSFYDNYGNLLGTFTLSSIVRKRGAKRKVVKK